MVNRVLKVLFVAVWVIGTLVNCQPTKTRVEVFCSEGIGGVVCSVQHLEGKVQALACWEVIVACNNGLGSSANGCQKVQPGVSAVRFIRYQDFHPSLGGCDQVASSRIKSIHVEAEK